MLEAAIWLVVQLVVLALALGLMIWLCDYCAREFPQVAPFAKAGKVLLVVVGVLVAVVLLLRFAGVS